MTCFHETPAAMALHAVVTEAREIIDREAPADPAERIRQHILDRWYRFEDFGVTSRADLAPLKVTVEFKEQPSMLHPDWGADVVPVHSTRFSFVGTPLEGKLR